MLHIPWFPDVGLGKLHSSPVRYCCKRKKITIPNLKGGQHVITQMTFIDFFVAMNYTHTHIPSYTPHPYTHPLYTFHTSHIQPSHTDSSKLHTLIPSSVKTQSRPAWARLPPTFSANSAKLSTPKSDKEKLVLQNGIGVLLSTRIGSVVLSASTFSSISRSTPNSFLASSLSTAKLDIDINENIRVNIIYRKNSS